MHAPAVIESRQEFPLNVVQLLPRLDMGGAERSALEIGTALLQAGHRCTLICGEGAWTERARAAGIEVISMNIGRKSPTSLLLVPRLRRILRGLQPDIVHARSRLPAWLGWMALRKMDPRPRFVTTVHGMNSVSRYSAIMLRGDAVIAVSQCTRDYLQQRYPQARSRTIDVIDRGIDPQYYHPTCADPPGWTAERDAAAAIMDRRPWMLLPGRGTRLKGHTDALNLVAELKARGKDTGLVLLGVVAAERQRYLRELHHWAEQLGIRDRVAFLPPSADPRPWYRNAQCVLQLSTRPETFGRVVAEALAMARPVIGYAHGGVGELLQRHFPFGKVPVGRIDDLADRVEALLDGVSPPLDPHVPTLQQMQQQTLTVYRRLLDHPT